MDTRTSYRTVKCYTTWGIGFSAAVVWLLASAGSAEARNNIRSAFFDVYPDAVGTAIETVTSNPKHCGN